jgi:hypothetical protein
LSSLSLSSSRSDGYDSSSLSSSSSSSLSRKVKKSKKKKKSTKKNKKEKRRRRQTTKTTTTTATATATTTQSSVLESSQPNPTISSIDMKIGKDTSTTAAAAAATKNKKKSIMMVPMSKIEYDKQQSQIREVYDPLSGRTRLIKGSGEVIERIVSNYQEHRQINSLATSGDGYAYTKSIYDKINKNK